MRSFRLLLGGLLLLSCQFDGDVGDDQNGIDNDGDGYSENEGDCDDDDDTSFPRAVEACDGRDNDCDGSPDEDGVCQRTQRFEVDAVVDLLIVVDDTESVREERAKLIASLESLLAPLWEQDHDTHVGLISSSVDDPAGTGVLHAFEGRRWASEEMHLDDAVAWLAEVVDVPSGLNNLEEPRAALFAALAVEDDGVNEGFRRDDAYLALVILSDEDDQTAAPTLDDFVDWLADEPGLDRVSGAAIVSDEGTDPCGSGAFGAEHIGLIDRIGGTVIPICTEDYSPPLEVASQSIAQLAPPRVYRLAQAAVPESVAVEVRLPSGFTNELSETGFVYDAPRQQVILYGDTPPSAGSRVTVHYRADPSN